MRRVLVRRFLYAAAFAIDGAQLVVQENFFKYLRGSFAFDALWTYDPIAADATRTVPSPCRRSERVPVGEVRAPDPVLELARAPKLLCDQVKMSAFHIETMLVAAIGPHLRRAPHEARAFIADVMRLDARLEPRGQTLDVVLARASAPCYTNALCALCKHVNALDPRFLGTTMRLRFRVDDP